MTVSVFEAERAFHVSESELSAIRRFLALIGERFDVRAAIVFGSHARGTQHPDSDVDVALLLGGEPGRFPEAMLALSDVAYDVLLETGVDISPLPIRLDEWAEPDAYPNPSLLRKIAAEGIRL